MSIGLRDCIIRSNRGGGGSKTGFRDLENHRIFTQTNVSNIEYFAVKMEERDVEGFVKEVDEEGFHKDMDDEIKKKKERQVRTII